MEIRKSNNDDINVLMEIYTNARQFMIDSGNSNQWINSYPQKELIEKDIFDGNSYVCIDSEKIVGCFAFIQGIDPTYIKIYDGEWLNNTPYGVVHRIAVVDHNKGIGTFCLNWCFDKCKNLRIDTHRDNIVMQNALFKNGFLYCGIIYLQNGAQRLAYQKI